MAFTERQRSLARRRAGKRLEDAHPALSRELRKLYSSDKLYVQLWGEKLPARLTEQVRGDIARAFRKQYRAFLAEEKEKIRDDVPALL